MSACGSRVGDGEHGHSASSNDCESILPAVVEMISFSLFLADF